MAYHISPNGPRLCKAEVRECPYGAAGDVHYDSQADAQAAYEARMSETFGGVETLHRSSAEALRQASYRALDGAKRAKSKTLEQARTRVAEPAVAKTHAVLASVKAAPSTVVRKAEAFDARQRERSFQAAERRDQRAERLAALATKSSTRMRDAVTEAPIAAHIKWTEARDAYFNGRAEARAARPVKPRFTAAHKIQIGDKLDDGNIVTGVQDLGETVRVSLRTPGGTFTKPRIYEDTRIVAVNRANKRELRGSQSANRKPWRESKLAKRVKAASAMQKEVVRTLMGADEKLRAAATREAQVKAPLPERYRRATARVSAERASAAVTLQTLGSRRSRARARANAS